MSYIASVLADLPVGGSFWKLDEASGALADSGGAGNALTALATPTYQQPGPLQAEPGYSMGFQTADNDGLSGGDIFEFTGTQAFALEIWANPSAAAAAQNPFLFGQFVASTEGWNFRYLSTGLIRLQRYQASAHSDCSSAAALAVGSWNYLVANYDGSNMALYLNAIQTGGPTASAQSIQANAATLAIGRFQTGGNAFDGNLAYPAIYPGMTLSQAQISAHFAAAQEQAALGFREPRLTFGPF